MEIYQIGGWVVSPFRVRMGLRTGSSAFRDRSGSVLGGQKGEELESRHGRVAQLDFAVRGVNISKPEI
jgi:hypothetical protein